MATEKQRNAFISYSRANKEFASKLAKELRSAGYPIWFDLFDIPTGARWDDEVEKALRECSVFMIILTSTSVASENVKDEIGYAIDHGKRILPVLLENCEVPLRLRRFQYVDFTTKSFEEGFENAKELLVDLVDEALIHVIAKASAVEVPIALTQTPVPVMTVEKKAKSVSTATSQKKPVSKGPVIGIVAVVLLVIAGIGFSIIFKRGSSNLSVVNPPEQVLVSGPITLNILSASEIKQLYENTKNFRTLAEETYGDQYSDMLNNRTPFNLENLSLEPLKLHIGWCALTHTILEENLTNIDFVLKFNGQKISDDKIAYVDETKSDGLVCRIYFSVIDNWVSGRYTISDIMESKIKINDGQDNYEAGVLGGYEYIVTIP